MRTIFCIIAIIFMLNLLGIDDSGKLHFVCGGLIAIGTQEIVYYHTNNEPTSFISGQTVAIGAGLGKEIYDVITDGQFNYIDWELTCLGAMCSVPINLIINRAFLPSYKKEKQNDMEYAEKIKKRWS